MKAMAEARKAERFRKKYIFEKNHVNEKKLIANFHILKNRFRKKFFALIMNELKNSQLSRFGHRYTNEVKNICTSIYLKSPTVYRMLSEINTLPSKETLRLYSLDISSQAGLTKEMIKLLRDKAARLNESEKICVLSIDETDVSPEFTYRPRHDFIDRYVDFGENGRTCLAAENALVFAIHGVTERWKQSIAFYDSKIAFIRETKTALGNCFNKTQRNWISCYCNCLRWK